MKKLSLVLLVFLIVSCNKREMEGDYTLTPTEKAYIPYQGGEKVVYTHSESGEEMVFNASSLIDETYEVISPTNSNNYYQYEMQYIVLEGTDIDLNYSVSADYKRSQNKAQLAIEWYNLAVFNSTRIFDRILVPIDSTDQSYNLIYHDTLTVDFNLYHNVYQGKFAFEYYPFGDTIPVPTGALYPLQYYYNQEYGIIKFMLSDSSNWELNQSDSVLKCIQTVQ